MTLKRTTKPWNGKSKTERAQHRSSKAEAKQQLAEQAEQAAAEAQAAAAVQAKQQTVTMFVDCDDEVSFSSPRINMS